MRCAHGFETSVVACPVGCGGPKPARQRKLSEPQPREPDQRVTAIVEEVAAELGGKPEAIVTPSAGWTRAGGLTFPVRARAEVVRRATERFGLTRYQVAKALGVPLKDLSYAVRRCA
ncbi:MAG TPA: hypothetical protein VFQ35_10885 [Polyangiaceae bacterium]|nr:hypothetical protein [Polyangiaceae bacterium]